MGPLCHRHLTSHPLHPRKTASPYNPMYFPAKLQQALQHRELQIHRIRFFSLPFRKRFSSPNPLNTRLTASRKCSFEAASPNNTRRVGCWENIMTLSITSPASDQNRVSDGLSFHFSNQAPNGRLHFLFHRNVAPDHDLVNPQ